MKNVNLIVLIVTIFHQRLKTKWKINYELTNNSKKMKKKLLRRCTNEMTQFRQIEQKRFVTKFQKLYENDFRHSMCMIL